ncbi:haloacetate dehalogenase [Methylobacterium gregans]|uniref:Fluoroacetate dehalogenase n=1 Tax=Methylobacterium gregans TaxID=374424 RepID=A0AA37MCB3_9HYPH|nr:alpha/beta hydrolase [Methylobacterium gregans]MDQ0520147.1 haloacetate dehalogenase [Methylobacterium gregans]GJD81045.1 Fluoroacetate dehalogenase [Methylobacterium gregans]GLS52550.1 haloacetate dehalogenase [Methylobacterium gregans]
MDGADLFPGFEALWLEAPWGKAFARAGGPETAPPLLLLHGFPESHAMWHRIAPDLARDHRVICLDLKGYGWSAAPPGDPAHEAYAKRTLGREIVALMERIGHVHFVLAGHDRGARVAYRLALDEPGRVARLVLIDIVPTAVQWERIEARPGLNPHWSFLAEAAPAPEQQIAAGPDAYFEGLLKGWAGSPDLAAFDPRALDLYRQAWNVPDRIHAMCEDYRAGAGPDRAADAADIAAGRTLAMPVLVLSSSAYLDKGKPETALEAWRRTLAPNAVGTGIAGGHFLAEENPSETLRAMRAFLAR